MKQKMSGKRAVERLTSIANVCRVKEFLPTFGLLVGGYLIGTGAGNIAYVPLLWLFVTFIFLGSSVFLLNDYFDYDFDKRRRGRVRSTGRNRLLNYALITLLAGFATGMLSFSLSTVEIFLLAYLTTYAYSAKPFRLKEKPFLDLISHGLVGSFLIMAGYSAAGHGEINMLPFLVSAFFLFADITLLQQIRDLKADKASGLLTTAAAIGRAKSVYLAKILIVASVIFFVPALAVPKYLLFFPAFLPLIEASFQKHIVPDAFRSWPSAMLTLAVMLGLVLLL